MERNQLHFFLNIFLFFLHNKHKFIIFVLLKRKTKERIKLEKELLFYLELYGEIRGRNETQKFLAELDFKIDELVEVLKH